MHYPVDESDNDSYYGDYDHDDNCYVDDWDMQVGDAEWEVSREAHDWEARRVKMADKKIIEIEMEEALKSVKLMFDRFEDAIDVADALLYIRKLFVWIKKPLHSDISIIFLFWRLAWAGG